MAPKIQNSLSHATIHLVTISSSDHCYMTPHSLSWSTMKPRKRKDVPLTSDATLDHTAGKLHSLSVFSTFRKPNKRWRIFTNIYYSLETYCSTEPLTQVDGLLTVSIAFHFHTNANPLNDYSEKIKVKCWESHMKGREHLYSSGIEVAVPLGSLWYAEVIPITVPDSRPIFSSTHLQLVLKL